MYMYTVSLHGHFEPMLCFLGKQPPQHISVHSASEWRLRGSNTVPIHRRPTQPAVPPATAWGQHSPCNKARIAATLLA